MEEHIRHAEYNYAFYEMLCQKYPDDYFDWKLVALFYTAFHYLKALARHKKINIGDRHAEINRNLMRGGAMPVSDTAFNNYMDLFHMSQDARYTSIPDLALFRKLREKDHRHALKCFSDFRKYIISRGVKLD
ncbi:MAG TPA: hypothetical protein VIM64_18510 [Puia sp.]